MSNQEPNIVFVGGRDGREPFREIINGDEKIKLPVNQAKPFYHKNADVICRLFGWLYKRVEPLGFSK